MRQNDMQAEAIMISTYCGIIKKILNEYKVLSLYKAITFAYILKKNEYQFNDIYNGHNNIDVVNKCLSQLTGAFSDYCDNLPFILKALHILIKNNIIDFNTKELVIIPLDSPQLPTKSNLNFFINKAIEESKKVSDRQFLKEVMYNV